MLSYFGLLVFPLLMAFAASSDLLTMRISNRLVLLLVCAFLTLALIINMPLQQFGLHLACAGLVLVCAFSFFAFGWIGGGDAKLAAATVLWLGFGVTLPYLLWSALLGGALTLLLLALRQWPLPAMLQKVTWIERLHDRKTGIPYGIALAMAGLLTYSNTPVFLGLVA